MQKTKKKIAVLGSGMSSLAATYELTSYPNWQDHYDITIYQMGWRLGGKTATGRGPKERIQEHGIHIAQGWYENAFRLIQDAYKECETNNLMPDSPFKSWRDAFEEESTTLLTHFDKETGKWIKKNIIFPSNDYVPGQGGPLPFSAIIEKAIKLVVEILFDKNPNSPGLLAHAKKQQIQPIQQHSVWTKIKDLIGVRHIEQTVQHEAEHYFNHLVALIQHMVSEKDAQKRLSVQNIIAELLKDIGGWFSKLVHGLEAIDQHFYWIVVFAEFGITNIKGILLDVFDPAKGELHYDKINHLDYREWLSQHGASQQLLESAIVRFLYVGTFHNLTGPKQQGALAAGVGLHFLTLSMGYKGAFVWKFKAGTADTMITPIYLVLKDRGVKFKFFHKVKQVHYSESGEIEEISMAEQVSLKNNSYTPTYKFKGIEVWPGEPLYDQIEDDQAKKLQANDIDLEMAWTNWKDANELTLHKGQEFDYAILGIPIDVLGGKQGICKEIIAKNNKWNAMYNHVKSIPTMSMQLWLKPGLKELGMNLKEWGFPEGSRPNLVTYASPQYSWIDMSQVMPYENWNGDKPGLLVYYTGSFLDPEVVPAFDDVQYPEQQKERVMRISEQWLRDNMGWFFKQATTGEYPEGIDFDIIFDFSEVATTDFAKLKTQYFRANVNPTDRYTLSLPGTNKYRLKADETGFENLVITGDWIDFGVNVGYYEGAIIAGLKAGQCIRAKLDLGVSTEIFDGVKMG
ncbi:MAG: NAD(P)-binding protein [Fulvivirga sp.]